MKAIPVLFACLLTPTGANAQTLGETDMPSFDRLDTNMDGAITIEEYVALPDFFAFVDPDGDNAISKAESAQLRDRLSALRR